MKITMNFLRYLPAFNKFAGFWGLKHDCNRQSNKVKPCNAQANGWIKGGKCIPAMKRGKTCIILDHLKAWSLGTMWASSICIGIILENFIFIVLIEILHGLPKNK